MTVLMWEQSPVLLGIDKDQVITLFLSDTLVNKTFTIRDTLNYLKAILHIYNHPEI